MNTTIKNLSFDYKAHAVLQGISFQIHEHEIIAVLGPNGAGKSTLLKCLNKILPFKQGSVLLDGQDLKSLSRLKIAQKIGYVGQRNETARLTAFDTILLGRSPHIALKAGAKDILSVNAIIEKLQLQDLALRYIDELSGGELQKVCIARALVQEPGLLLLDEPTSSLDLRNQVEILNLIRTIADEHAVSVILSLHDINMAVQYADRIVFIKDKQIHTICRREEITEEIVQAVYGIAVVLHDTPDYPVVIPARSRIKEET